MVQIEAQLPKENKEHPTIERRLLKTKGYRRDRILPFFFSEKLEVDWMTNPTKRSSIRILIGDINISTDSVIID
jgi:hypothetical protein